MDITPRVTEGRVTLDSYGGGSFSAQGTRVEGNALVFPMAITTWNIPNGAEITVESLQPFLDMADDLDIVLIGCGERMRFLSAEVKQAFEQKGVGIDPMDTGAACRTFNILAIEERRVAAALFAVD